MNKTDLCLNLTKIEAQPTMILDNIALRIDNIPNEFKLVETSTKNLIDSVHQGKVTLASNKHHLTFEHGRLINTRAFSDDLLSITSVETDPLVLGLLKAKTPKTWQREVHWSSAQKPLTVISDFSYFGEKSILLQNTAIDTQLFIEKVQVPALKLSFINQFWLDKNTERLVKSIQYFSPKMPSVTLSIFENIEQQLLPISDMLLNDLT